MDTENLKHDLKEKPYEFICDYYEELFPFMGKKVMSILSLLPPSLIIPYLTDSNGKKIRARISYLLLSQPGTAKSALSEHFKKFAYDPIPFESITDSKLNFLMSFKKRATLITSDVARIFNDKELVKEMENIIGDEGKLSRLNRNTGDEEQKVDAIGYFAGTPDNLTHTIKDGMVFRVVPQISYHTEKEHSEILKKVNQSIGRGTDNDFLDKEEYIIKFYRDLLAIQEGESKEINPIEGYIIPEEFRKIIEDKLIPLFNKPFRETNFEFIREIQQCYRFMVSHAFLNIFNREIIDNKIKLSREDLEVALNLSIQEINTKLIILNSLNRISERRLRTNQELKSWAYSQKRQGNPLSLEEYKTMETILKNKY